MDDLPDEYGWTRTDDSAWHVFHAESLYGTLCGKWKDDILPVYFRVGSADDRPVCKLCLKALSVSGLPHGNNTALHR